MDTALKKTSLFITLISLFLLSQAQTSYNVGGGTSTVRTCNAILYDHAGTGNYSGGRDDWFTIYPNSGAVNLLFEEMDIAVTDTLYIYNGENQAAETVALMIGGRATNWVNNDNPIQIGDRLSSIKKSRLPRQEMLIIMTTSAMPYAKWAAKPLLHMN